MRRSARDEDLHVGVLVHVVPSGGRPSAVARAADFAAFAGHGPRSSARRGGRGGRLGCVVPVVKKNTPAVTATVIRRYRRVAPALRAGDPATCCLAFGRASSFFSAASAALRRGAGRGARSDVAVVVQSWVRRVPPGPAATASFDPRGAPLRRPGRGGRRRFLERLGLAALLRHGRPQRPRPVRRPAGLGRSPCRSAVERRRRVRRREPERGREVHLRAVCILCQQPTPSGPGGASRQPPRRGSRTGQRSRGCLHRCPRRTHGSGRAPCPRRWANTRRWRPVLERVDHAVDRGGVP